MATKSILKNISLKKSIAGKKLIKALEAAESHPTRKIVMSRTVNRVDRDKIREALGDI